MRVHHQENPEKKWGGTKVLVPGHQNSGAPYVPDCQRLVFLFFLPEPFVFGEWTKTDKCSESCGKEGRVLEQRTCTPTHPHKSCSSLPIERTLRPSNESCADQPCEGLFSVEIFVIKRKHLQGFTLNGRTGQSAKLQTARKTQTWPSWPEPKPTWLTKLT